MKIIGLEINLPETPEGKRTVKANVWGNVVGYVSGKRFWEFGTGAWDEYAADRWEAGASLEEAIHGEAEVKYVAGRNPASKEWPNGRS